MTKWMLPGSISLVIVIDIAAGTFLAVKHGFTTDRSRCKYLQMGYIIYLEDACCIGGAIFRIVHSSDHTQERTQGHSSEPCSGGASGAHSPPEADLHARRVNLQPPQLPEFVHGKARYG
ncbi:hypothetical protein BU25DRAFT_417269 [Macroventuria anomochaeta]|uniref:Uncharacterized protein n=1 Tax=Macroventuria anomochaeta TaxID=301207 RepID=A0ACB6SH41_9PLEO|nr:uncharacterized protein BU25DRAFT_417269 [Macroventuria anomochaeta]KAF2632663.1 hypothetical protein BU25DRAFT_417269 [Macroventuria anomochaeta]